MAGGFSIGIAADTKAFEAGVKAGIIQPVEKAQDKLDDLGKSGDKAGDGLSKSVKDGEQSLGKLAQEAKQAGSKVESGMRDAERATDKLGAAGKDAGDDLERGLKDAQKQTALTADDYKAMTAKIESETQRLKASGKESFSPAAESSKAFKEEAVANLSEVSSSFDGSASSITDLFQGTLGGIITELGPLGLAVGTAAAVGVGLIGAAFSQSGEDAQAFQDRVDSMTSEILSDFTDTGDAVSAIDKKLREWASDNEKYGTSLVQLRKDAKDAGVGFDDLATTIAGGTTKQLRSMRGEIDDSIDALSKQAAAVDTTAGADRSASDAAQAKVKRLNEDVVPAINQQIKANENAKAAEEALAAANDMTVSQYRKFVDAQNAAKDAADEFSDGVQSAYAEAGAAQQGFTDDGKFDLDQYIAKTSDTVKQLEDLSANMATSVGQLGKDGHDKAIQYLESLGSDAAPLVDAFVKAPADKQADLARIWDTLGNASSSSFGSGLQRGLNNQGAAVKNVTVVPDMDQFNAAMREATKQREAHIKVYSDNQGGTRQGMGSP